MSLRRYLGSETFDPETTVKMSRAFLRAVQTLGVEHDDVRREAVAQFIIQMIQWNGRQDENALYTNTVTAMRGLSDDLGSLRGPKPDSRTV
jgi:hypothetical protein